MGPIAGGAAEAVTAGSGTVAIGFFNPVRLPDTTTLTGTAGSSTATTGSFYYIRLTDNIALPGTSGSSIAATGFAYPTRLPGTILLRHQAPLLPERSPSRSGLSPCESH